MLRRQTTSGAAKKIEIVTASGRYFSAVKFSTVLIIRSSALRTCRRGVPEQRSPRPPLGRNSTSAQPKCTA